MFHFCKYFEEEENAQNNLQGFKIFFFNLLLYNYLILLFFLFFTIAKHLFFIDIFKQSATFLTPLLSKDNKEFFITQSQPRRPYPGGLNQKDR